MRVKLQLYSTLICALGIAVGFACKLLFPKYWFDGYVVILMVFYLVEMMISFLLYRYEGKMSQTTLEGKNFMKKYMMIKGGKVICTIAMIGVYVAMQKDNPNGHVVEFALMTVVFYLLNLVTETYVVSNEIKKEKNQ